MSIYSPSPPANHGGFAPNHCDLPQPNLCDKSSLDILYSKYGGKGMSKGDQKCLTVKFSSIFRYVPACCVAK